MSNLLQNNQARVALSFLKDAPADQPTVDCCSCSGNECLEEIAAQIRLLKVNIPWANYIEKTVKL